MKRKSSAQLGREEYLKNSFVTAELRQRAFDLVDKMPIGEKRTHAYAFVKFRGRTTKQIESFIERMNNR